MLSVKSVFSYIISIQNISVISSFINSQHIITTILKRSNNWCKIYCLTIPMAIITNVDKMVFNIQLIRIYLAFPQTSSFPSNDVVITSSISLPLFSEPPRGRTSYISQRPACRCRINERRIESRVLVTETYPPVFRLLSAAKYHGMLHTDRLYYSAAAVANNFAISGRLIWARWRYAFNGNVDSGESSSVVHRHHRYHRYSHHYCHRQ